MQSTKIYHNEKRPKNFKQMIHDCAINIHMRSQSEKLLLFYANQKHGFAPYLSYMSKETGIPQNKISEIRKKLVDYGLIAYNSEKKYIYIAWNRIRSFAMLEKPLRITRDKCKFLPFKDIPPEERKRNKTIGELGKQYIIKEPRKLSKEEERFFNILESMTEDEYILMVEGIRQTEFPHYPRGPMVEEAIKRQKSF